MNSQAYKNRLELIALIKELGAERYTPAGILVRDFVLMHESTQVELGASRQVDLTIKAIAFDEVAHQLRQVEMSLTYLFRGFLAQKGQSKHILFHIQAMQVV